jgi:hypothetical protein
MTSILIKIGAVLALLAALFFAEQYIEGLGYSRARAEDQEAAETLKAQAAATLATETEKTRNAEQALQTLTNAQNLKDADHEKIVADLSSRLRVAAGPAGRLRDPHAVGCGAGGGGTQSATASPANDSAADGAQTGGVLSKQLTELLQQLTASADTINVAYASCRADAYAVRGAQAP